MLRRSPWKLVIKSTFNRSTLTPKALYNLETDPGEKHNHLNELAHAQRVKQMFDEYMAILKSGKPTVGKSAAN